VGDDKEQLFAKYVPSVWPRQTAVTSHDRV